MVEIPLMPKPPVVPSPEMKQLSINTSTVDGKPASDAAAPDDELATGKRKREGEDEGGDRSPGGSNGHSAKRPASKPAVDADSSEPIVLDDDDEEGIIELDD